MTRMFTDLACVLEAGLPECRFTLAGCVCGGNDRAPDWNCGNLGQDALCLLGVQRAAQVFEGVVQAEREGYQRRDADVFASDVGDVLRSVNANLEAS